MKPKGWYSGFVDLWSLPKNLVMVGFGKSYKSNMLNCLKQIASRHNTNSLAELLGETLDTLTPFCLRNFNISLKLLEKFSSLLVSKGYKEFTRSNITKHIKVIKCRKSSKEIVNPKLPFDFRNPAGAILISAIYHDGGVMINTKQPYYTNYVSFKRKTVKNSFLRVFGKIKSRGINFTNRKQITFPRIVGIILVYGIGLPYGQKAIQNVRIPEFIFESSNRLKQIYLKQAFDDEGNVDIGSKQIGFKQASKTFLLDTINLIKSLQIETKGPYLDLEYRTVKYGLLNSKRMMWKLVICGKENLERFSKLINFSIKYKRKELYYLIDSYKQQQFNNWQEEIMKIIKEIEMEKGSFTRKDLDSITKRSTSRNTFYLRELLQKSLIKKLEDKKFTRKGPTFVKYTTSKISYS